MKKSVQLHLTLGDNVQADENLGLRWFDDALYEIKKIL